MPLFVQTQDLLGKANKRLAPYLLNDEGPALLTMKLDVRMPLKTMLEVEVFVVERNEAKQRASPRRPQNRRPQKSRW